MSPVAFPAYTQSLVPKRPSVALLKGLFDDGLDALDSLSGNPVHSIDGAASDLFRRPAELPLLPQKLLPRR